MKKIASFDLGGTDIKYGIIDADGPALIMKSKIPTNASKGAKHVIDTIIQKINELKEEHKLLGVAISSAGVINSDDGIVLNATRTIPKFLGTKIKAMIEEETLLPCTVENDVNCFALAEAAQHPDIKDFILITLGTGIGGGIVIDHKIYRGASYASGEVGSMYIGDSSWEDTSSVKALVAIAQAQEIPVNNGIELFELYDKNDRDAVMIVNHWYRRVAKGLSNLIYLFNPEMIAIGGAISNRLSLIDELLPFLKETCIHSYLINTKITRATLHNDGGLWGAYYHFISKIKLN